MRERVKNTGIVRAAVIGVATMLLGGCSETGQFGNTFGSPFASSRPPVDRTPTGSLPPNEQVQNFFSEAFKPFDAQQPSRQAQPAPRVRAASVPSYAPPAPIAAAPIAPVSAAPLAPIAAQASSPAPVGRIAAGAVGGWTSEGGAAVAAGPGDTPALLAQRYGVPVDALMGVNGFASRGALPAGTRVVIPVYAARNGGRNFAAPPIAAPSRPAVALAAPAAPAVSAQASGASRAAAHSLVAEESEAVRPSPGRPERNASPRGPEKTPSRAELAPKNLGTLPQQARLQEARPQEARPQEARPQEEPRRRGAVAKTDMAKAEPQIPAETPHGRKAAKVAEAEADRRDAVEAPAKATKPAPTPAMAPRSGAGAHAAVPVATPNAIPGAVAPSRAETAKMARLETKPAAAQIAAPAAQPAPAAQAPAEKPAVAEAAAAPDSANPEFRWPARGRVIQGFGNGGNDGINIAVPEGTQVKAAEGGVVAYAGSELKGYGNLVLIRHPNGFVTAYANNGALNVKKGDAVKRGQTIALSGQSGNVSSPQLHFELRKGSKPVDPTNYLAGL